MAVPIPKMPADWELTPAPEDADPFRYGWRPRYVHLPGGEVEEERIPLTAEDLLDPQPGDVILEDQPHANVTSFLHVLLDVHFETDVDVLVTHDLKMVWGIPGLSEPAPDIAVIRGKRIKERFHGGDTFEVAKEGVLPSLAIEVVSPKYAEVRDNDYVKKKDLYERVGIPEYLMVEPYPVPENLRRHPIKIRHWLGYRLGPDGRYQMIEPDGEGRLLSETTGLLFGIAADRYFEVTDVRTGKVLLNQSQLAAAQRATEERADQEAQRAEREAEARVAAEQRAEREAQRADQETEARKAAEAELARLRAELERR
jgi:Uma2 family endonuclease